MKNDIFIWQWYMGNYNIIESQSFIIDDDFEKFNKLLWKTISKQ